VVRLTLGQLIDRLGGDLQGSPDIEISGLATLSTAGQHDLAFLSHLKYRSQFLSSQAACVVVSRSMAPDAAQRGATIVVDDAYAYWASVTQLWSSLLPANDEPLIHPSAFIHPLANIHPTARIGPMCVIEAHVVIGRRTWLKSSVTVSQACSIGEECILHPGVVIGADGFGFALDHGAWSKIEQLGSVRIGNRVEIGANTCIDRGALGETVIEDGVKLDNLIQIGHNVSIGAHTAMAGCVGIAGSATIGSHCTLGGGAIVLGHLQLVDHVHVSAASVVTRSLLQAGTYSGVFPIDNNDSWQKNAATLRQLHSLRDRIKQLESGLPQRG
jgi:UDP-3-O-[3-hydroxymyristoyl] glucosamine N-acyltransferase